MADGCGMGGVGIKPKPLLSIEVSSLVRVQEDKFTQWSLLYSIWFLFMLIVMLISSKSTAFFTVTLQRIFSFVT